ncbi:uncharacterized protein MONBRDRAFT_36980 [Monosiga brevicollis MX1]|uniref:tRNA/rRNA methyltransferase SpoU type domain-containing protein n=1 Tax=Monosiga brevicollis TaxID=81824 RepID=A9UYT1_MONBE|nr:uncharacterized protein MONBRDRAFT_36980 [Monosiga brevicollis MX1]EDQ89659.1 predicted protein [Monosiga brevicollis MX1]|eukprot:XP_001745688.1 hypothetical protein [Monosiga brevicollis MX1]
MMQRRLALTLALARRCSVGTGVQQCARCLATDSDPAPASAPAPAPSGSVDYQLPAASWSVHDLVQRARDSPDSSWSDADVLRLARLSALHVNQADLPTFKANLQQIDAFVAQVQDAPIDDTVEPLVVLASRCLVLNMVSFTRHAKLLFASTMRLTEQPMTRRPVNQRIFIVPRRLQHQRPDVSNKQHRVLKQLRAAQNSKDAAIIESFSVLTTALEHGFVPTLVCTTPPRQASIAALLAKHNVSTHIWTVDESILRQLMLQPRFEPLIATGMFKCRLEFWSCFVARCHCPMVLHTGVLCRLEKNTTAGMEYFKSSRMRILSLCDCMLSNPDQRPPMSWIVVPKSSHTFRFFTSPLEVMRAPMNVCAHVACHGLFGYVGTASLTPAPADWRRLVVVAAQDPHNVGSIVRTALAFGADAICVWDGAAQPLTAATIKASAGHVFAGRFLSPTEVLRAARSTASEVAPSTLWTAAEAHAPSSWSHRQLEDVAWPHRRVLVLGHETRGVPRDLQPFCQPVHIAIHPGVESLSVAAAAAILCDRVFAFECAKQSH